MKKRSNRQGQCNKKNFEGSCTFQKEKVKVKQVKYDKGSRTAYYQAHIRFNIHALDPMP